MLTEIQSKYEELKDEINKVCTEISELEETPYYNTNASIHWKLDRNGNKTIMQLVHKNRKRAERHEYIGKNPTKQSTARQMVDLGNRYIYLSKRYKKLSKLLYKIDDTLELMLIIFRATHKE